MKTPINPSTFWTTGSAKILSRIDDLECCLGEGNCCLYGGFHLSAHVDEAEFPISNITTEEVDRLAALAGAMERYAASIRKLLDRQADSLGQLK